MVLRCTMGALAGLLLGCSGDRNPEDPTNWYAEAQPQDVEEYISFTDENYSFPTDPNDGIAAKAQSVFPVDQWSTAFGPDDDWSDNDCDSSVDADLPFEIEGIVTLHPRWYFKSHGCDDGDEKFYGSFFIQDGTGGLFVLGDSKVAHFDMGAKVRMRVRGVRTLYDLNVIYAHDILEIDHGPHPIYSEQATEALDLEDVGLVKSVTGTVITGQDTFGEFQIETDTGVKFSINIDADLARRGFGFDPGTRINVRGPVLYSYSAFGILVIKSGQVTVQ